MNLQTLLTLATLGLAVAAEPSVVSLFIFDADPQSLVGSVVAASASTTTYSINCGPGVEEQDCGFLPGLMFTAGPTTVQWALSKPYDVYGRVICSLGGTTTAVCTDVMPSTGSHSRPSQTTTLGPDEISLLPVTITAGPSVAASASGTEASTSTGSNGNGNGSRNTASQTPGASSSTSTGGLPRITAKPGAVLGGVAAAFVVAAL